VQCAPVIKLCDCDSPARIDAKLARVPDDLDGRAPVSMSIIATLRIRLPQGASGSEKLSQNAQLSFVAVGSPPILPPAAQQNRKRDRTTQGRIEPMDLLFSKIKQR
jgi:hypothetical protein